MTWKTSGFLVAVCLSTTGFLKGQSFGRIETYAGTKSGGTTADGVLATSANLRTPTDVAVNPANGDIYLADNGHHIVRKINRQTLIITTVAGTGTQGYNGDNQPATSAQLNNPYGVVLDSAGNLYSATPTTRGFAASMRPHKSLRPWREPASRATTATNAR
jgi:DNA-binding beta-propeller fold protein YncE